MFSKSLVFWCLIVKSFCTEASIIPTQSSTNDNCICAGKSNEYGEGSECANYEGYNDDWYNGKWCYAATDTCSDANDHADQDHGQESGYGASRAACDQGVKLNNSSNHNDGLEERVDILSRKLFALESRIEDLIKVNNLSSTANTNTTSTRTSTVSTTTTTATLGDHLVILGGQDVLGVQVILGGQDVNRNTLSDVELLDMQTEDNGCDPTDLPSPVYRHASVYSSVLQSLITCGGSGSNERLSSCSVETKNGHHISIPSMNSRRTSFAMVAIHNKLYSLGGWATKNTMETLEMNATGTWNQESMPFSVYGHCAIALDNNIIVIGGKDENWNDLDTTWIYNVVKKDWTEGPKLNEKRYDHACLVDEETNTIHIIGGSNGRHLKSTEKWIFGTDSWISGASLPESVYRSAAVNSNSEETIGYLVAGLTYNGPSSKVWSLRRRDLMWIEDGSKKLKTAREYHTVVNIPGDQIPGC